MKVATGHITSIAGNDEFSPDSAKVRLHEAAFRPMREMGMAKLREKYSEQGVSVLEPTVTVLANNMAKAFVIHAEGDEYKVNTEKIQERFSDDMINKLMPGCYNMLCSMLKDLSPYGVEGRENQTDDLSLTINMGPPVPAGIHGIARSVDSKCCYDLNGRLLQAPPTKGLYIRGGKKQMK